MVNDCFLAIRPMSSSAKKTLRVDIVGIHVESEIHRVSFLDATMGPSYLALNHVSMTGFAYPHIQVSVGGALFMEMSSFFLVARLLP